MGREEKEEEANEQPHHHQQQQSGNNKSKHQQQQPQQQRRRDATATGGSDIVQTVEYEIVDEHGNQLMINGAEQLKNLAACVNEVRQSDGSILKGTTSCCLYIFFQFASACIKTRTFV